MAKSVVILGPAIFNIVPAPTALKVNRPYRTPLLVSAMTIEDGRPPPAPRSYLNHVSDRVETRQGEPTVTARYKPGFAKRHPDIKQF